MTAKKALLQRTQVYQRLPIWWHGLEPKLQNIHVAQAWSQDVGISSHSAKAQARQEVFARQGERRAITEALKAKQKITVPAEQAKPESAPRNRPKQ